MTITFQPVFRHFNQIAEAAYKKLCRGIAYDHATHLLFPTKNELPAGVTLI